ncbi:HupE/UreJ family protein [filamentous cyanobacterium LEGE 11480]|uniref:HupE/UreJ family protein n=1 Tax=Romeriopsis navalis LEGE 11480 TaxID=2777977 RepID=A0A928Z5S2_9CYAN|nr:HupE/UreJ family protein [Romeriopsis navalis]MBE9031565.1 HupE/UreJ family protein [Romeriopsis navalis LEGE 11480]
MKHLKYLITACCLTLLLIVYSGAGADAHWADSAVGEITITQKSAEFVLTLPSALLDVADDNRDGQITADEIQQNQAVLTNLLNDRVQLTDQTELGQLEQIALRQSAPANPTHTTIALTYRWKTPIEALQATYKLFLPDAPNARCVVTISHQGNTQSVIFSPLSPTASLIKSPILQQAKSFMLLGIEHILTGYDHILFIVSLLLMAGSLSQISVLIMAFTIGHSITLALAVLNVVSLPSQLVESLIALSIVYVAVEAMRRKSMRYRWLTIFGLGMIHGLGFAGILQDLAIIGQRLGITLFSFNLGLEVGQILIIIIGLTVISACQRIRCNQGWRLNLLRTIAAGIAITGSTWFMQRAFLG